MKRILAILALAAALAVGASARASAMSVPNESGGTLTVAEMQTVGPALGTV